MNACQLKVVLNFSLDFPPVRPASLQRFDTAVTVQYSPRPTIHSWLTVPTPAHSWVFFFLSIFKVLIWYTLIFVEKGCCEKVVLNKNKTRAW